VIDGVLRRILASVVGARCVVLAAADGVLVASAVAPGGPAPDAVAAAMGDLLRRVAAAHRDAGLVPPSEFASGGPDGQAALRVVTNQYVLIVVLSDPRDLGRARHALRLGAAELEPELV
jgi:predicted regulator of Ras-like GTPase activity (Roadblock/LC7/MglB family)